MAPAMHIYIQMAMGRDIDFILIYLNINLRLRMQAYNCINYKYSAYNRASGDEEDLEACA